MKKPYQVSRFCSSPKSPSKPSPKLAFSLIELSVVILVIGIFVVGVTQGKKAIDSARLASARSLTKGSPVNLNGDNLALWLDAASEKAFNATEAVNGARVSTWYDTKLFASTNPLDVTGSGNTRPLYISNSTNGLPGVSFDGTDDGMSKVGAVSSDTISQGNNQITVFVVQKYYTPDHSAASIVFDSGTSRFLLLLYGTVMRIDFGPCCPGASVMQYNPPSTFRNRTNIITVVHRPDSTQNIKINGTQYASATGLTSVLSGSGGFSIGGGGGLKLHGDINEIIIFKTALTNTEISGIEKYLSDKWGVPLTGL